MHVVMKFQPQLLKMETEGNLKMSFKKLRLRLLAYIHFE